jgi:hypothetical protein
VLAAEEGAQSVALEAFLSIGRGTAVAICMQLCRFKVVKTALGYNCCGLQLDVAEM